MKKGSDAGIGVGVASPSGGQVVLSVMKGIVCCTPPNNSNRHPMVQKHAPIHSKIQVLRAIWPTNR